jgi:hypothetical protein
MPDGRIFVATTSIVTTIDGHNRSIHRNQTAREGHPILKSHGDIFVPLVPDFEVDDKPAAAQPVTPPVAPRPLGRRGAGRAEARSGE